MAIMSNAKMSKVLHVINDTGKISVRKYYDVAANALLEHPERYDPDVHFMDHERSAFLDHILNGEQYVQVSAHAFGQEDMDIVMDWLSVRARRGFYTVNEEMGRVHWKFLYGHYVDKGSMFMIKSDSQFKSLDDLGIHVINPTKVPKRFKRVAAPHEYAVFGKVKHIFDDDFGQIVEFELDNGYIGQHRSIDEDKAVAAGWDWKLVDGMNLVQTRFLREQMQIKDRNLSTWAGKGTGFSPMGVDKGYFHAKDDLEFDIVTYGTKKELVYDNYFFGFLGGLKPGEMYRSDLQSLTNFGMADWCLPATQLLIEEINARLADPDALRGYFLSRLYKVSKVEGDASATETWCLINAIEAGVNIMNEPALFRRVYNHLTRVVLDCENGSIPFDHLGVRCDICPDPHMFDEYGEIHPENSVIPNGCCVAMDVPEGPVEAYRQPNGTANERSSAMNIRLRQFDKFEGRQRIFYGADLAQVLDPQNGADLDDTSCVIHDPALVKHMRTLSYPLEGKVVPQAAEKKTLGRYYDQLKRSIENLSTASYTAEDFIDNMQTARQMTMQLGTTVNDIMRDTLLSGPHKVNMMKYLAEKIQNEPDKDRKIWWLDRREWLANREEYRLRAVGSNLEGIIDLCVAGKGNYAQFEDFIKLCAQDRAETQVFPMLFAKAGTGFQGMGRITNKKQLGVDYCLAPSLLCAALQDVEFERNVFLNDLRAYEWNCITFVPDAVEDMYPSSPDINRIARDIRSMWIPKIVAAMSGNNQKLKRAAYNNALYGTKHECQPGICPVNCAKKGLIVDEGMQQWLEAYEEVDRKFIAVELKRLCHNRAEMKFNDDGSVRQVPDGVFGNNVVFNYYLQALDDAGLTGKYMPVELDTLSNNKRIKDGVFQVYVKHGAVIRKSDDFWIGTTDAQNGEYKLVNGMLELRAPDKQISERQNFDATIRPDGVMPNAVQL